ncbi:hypothetical protein EJ08DRAFT_652891 [Tothia fuscella]|uniref:ABM domain-containing protein n=1 Tax=Tothia fuscella TaxID=1048955 RepID=A0A9P4NIR1_9PEZI|nr:hypothetical protein EJ08DRAFT_652891 [Tothia fuscella]
MPSPLTVHVTITIDPSNLPTFYSALKTLSEKLKQEPECLYLNVFEIAQSPGVVRLVEMWDADVEWMMNVQSKKEYYGPFFEVVEKIQVGERKVEVLAVKEGFKFAK